MLTCTDVKKQYIAWTWRGEDEGGTCSMESSAMSWQVSVGTLPRKPLSFTSSTVSPIASTWAPHQTAC